MTLVLVKNESKLIIEEDQIKFGFFKNMIKKDLEIACWSNKAIKVFGEFKIYSDYSTELNSFEYIVSFLTGTNVVALDDSLEDHISTQCHEHFLSLLIWKDKNFSKSDVEVLSVKFTKYLLEATNILNERSEVEARVLIQELDIETFGGNDPTEQNFNSQYLN